MLISCPSSGISDYPQKPWFPLVTTIELRDTIEVPQLNWGTTFWVPGVFLAPGIAMCVGLFSGQSQTDPTSASSPPTALIDFTPSTLSSLLTVPLKGREQATPAEGHVIALAVPHACHALLQTPLLTPCVLQAFIQMLPAQWDHPEHLIQHRTQIPCPLQYSSPLSPAWAFSQHNTM